MKVICRYCKKDLKEDRANRGPTWKKPHGPWVDQDGDSGCDKHPRSNTRGVRSHLPEVRA